MSDSPYDERLWFEHNNCTGRHYLIGNAHTFRGRILAWCPKKSGTCFVSRDEMTFLAPEAEYWIRGFLTGAEPSPPENEDELLEYEGALAEFHRRGVWPQPGWNSTGALEDADFATRHGLIFEVETKAKRGAPWVSKAKGVSNLFEALRLARESESWEVTVLVHRLGSIETFPYWTSRTPESFRSTVLHRIVHQNTECGSA